MSGTWLKSIPASADLTGDDYDGFIDIGELLSGKQQKGLVSVDSYCGGMADMVDNGTRGSRPSYSSRSMARSSRGEYTKFLSSIRISYLHKARSDYNQ